MDADANSKGTTSSRGLMAADRHIAQLEARVKQPEDRVEGLSRSGKRQAAPFSRGLPKVDPRRPSRKGGPETARLGYTSCTTSAAEAP